jgi:hypothetical protein
VTQRKESETIIRLGTSFEDFFIHDFFSLKTFVYEKGVYVKRYPLDSGILQGTNNIARN